MTKIKDKINYFDVLLFFMILIYPEFYRYIWWIANRITARIGIRVGALFINGVVWGIYFILYRKEFLKRIKPLDVGVYFVLVFIFAMFYTFSPHSKFTTERFLTLIFQVLPFYFCGKIYRFDREQLKIIYPVTAIAFFMSYVYTSMFVIPRGALISDNMYAAYKVLPLVLILVSSFLESEYRKYSIVGIFGVLYVVMLGTRGPILCIAVFLILMLLKKLGTGKFVILSCTILVGIGIFVASSAFSTMMFSVAQKAEQLGFSTRILDMTQDEEMLETSGRDVIAQMVIESIKEKPLAMPGPYSDWNVTGIYRDPNDPNAGNYSHNLFLEIWSNYGVLFGTLINVLILLMLIRLILKCDRIKIMVPCIFVCCGFVMLMLSNTYLEVPNFWVLLGLCMNKEFLKYNQRREIIEGL